MPSKLSIPASLKSLGEAIRFAREKRGITLRRLAKLVGISAPFVSDIEHNRRKTDKLPEFAKALGVELAELKQRDGRLPDDVKDWIAANPEIVELLEEMRTSGHTPAQLRASLRRKR